MEKNGFSGNQLKMLAVITMTIDHIGVYLFPAVLWMRLVGRLAFPIFAFMVGEGAKHTRNLTRYFLTMALSALVCQSVITIYQGSLYQCILVTFSLSLGSILLIQIAEEKKTILARFGAICGLGAVFVICKILPRKIPGFVLDYGLFGALAPVAVYLAKNKLQSIFCLTVCLIGIAEGTLWVQWLSLLAVPLLLLYNGQRGKWKMKWFFYLYYPAHLVAINFADIILHG